MSPPRIIEQARRPRQGIKLWALSGAVAVTVLLCATIAAAELYGRWQEAVIWEQTRARNPTTLGALQAVWTGNSFAYLLWPEPGTTTHPSPLLIDAGSDPKAQAIAAALAQRGVTLADVAHVLLTHGHAQHTAGLMALPHSTVHVAMADGTLALGDIGPHNLWIRTRQRLHPLGRLPPRQLTFVHPGERLRLSGHTLTVVALPGHTRGSVGYLWQHGLIAGDAVFGPSVCSPVLAPPSAWMQEAPELARAVLARVPLDARAFVADGHTGINPRCLCAGTPPPP